MRRIATAGCRNDSWNAYQTNRMKLEVGYSLKQHLEQLLNSSQASKQASKPQARSLTHL